jgi:hypothetical protein
MGINFGCFSANINSLLRQPESTLEGLWAKHPCDLTLFFHNYDISKV